MTQEDKAKAYDEAIKRAKSKIKNDKDHVLYEDDIIEIFPELKESGDEKIRKNIIIVLKSQKDELGDFYKSHNTSESELVNWLEKQGKCETDCHSNHQDANHPNGCITLEDFNGGEGFYKVHLDYLNEKQVEEIEEMIRTWNKESKVPNENIKSCIGMCLTDVGEQRFKDYNTSLKDCLAWLEKQGKQKNFDYENANIQQKDFAPKQEPKFKVGDLIVNDYCMGKVIALTDDAYLLDTEQGIPFSCEHNAHRWTIEDAKAGDILANDTIVLIVDNLGTFENRPIIYSWYFADSNKFYGIGPSEPDRWEVEGFHPATKEQRGLLFEKMKEAGYDWNAEKKELKKISQRMISTEAKEAMYNKPAWSEEDEETSRGILNYLCLHDACELEGFDSWYNWLKSSIKDKVQSLSQPKEWSEEDEKILNSLISSLARIGASTRTDSTSVNYTFLKEIDWLKSLKQRYTWKPSDELLDIFIKNATDFFESNFNPLTDGGVIGVFDDKEKMIEEFKEYMKEEGFNEEWI